MKFGIGQGVPRWEDPRLLRGGGRYSDDLNRPGQAHGYVVRSPHAHARIAKIDVGAARKAPGVLGVYTTADIEADNLGTLPCAVPRQRPGGKPMYSPPYRILAKDEVKLVGDAVAFVVAETVAQARDAAELIEVEYDALPSLTATADALKPGAPTVWKDCPDNVCFVFELGNKAAVEAAFKTAHHVTKLEMHITRVSIAPMEPRACIGEYDRFEERYTLYTGSQGPHGMRTPLAQAVFKVPENRVRVISQDMGGAFGMRSAPYRENVLCMWAAKKLDRPVKWVGDRTESFVSDDQARDNISTAELALDKDGKFLALRVTTVANMGAYLSLLTPHSSTNNLGTLANTYTTPAIYTHVTAVLTNTPPVGPYRGAGRPEASYVIERVIDAAAQEVKIDPVELRRRNLIPESAMPYKTGLVFTYDSGQFEKNMDGALKLADYKGFPARLAEAKQRGKLRGIGVANAIEQSAGGPPEWAQIRFDPTGAVTLFMGTHNHGQGHETIFRQILSDQLGIEWEQVRLSQGDSDAVIAGTGSFGSRSSGVGGASIRLAAQKVIAKGKKVAAHIMEAAEADIEFANGTFTVAGTDKSMSLVDVAKATQNFMRVPPGVEAGLDEWAAWAPKAPTFPNGAHACEVEIDPDTGVVELVGYWAVDDVGTVINPLLLEGQIMGGAAQGIGQILLESVVWDHESGQIVSGSFMDYAMPRADNLPSFTLETNEVKTPTNPFGIKGGGEAGCVGATPVAMNAIVNALQQVGVRTLDMPASPERVWRAIQAAKAARSGRLSPEASR